MLKEYLTSHYEATPEYQANSQYKASTSATRRQRVADTQSCLEKQLIEIADDFDYYQTTTIAQAPVSKRQPLKMRTVPLATYMAQAITFPPDNYKPISRFPSHHSALPPASSLGELHRRLHWVLPLPGDDTSGRSALALP